MNSDQTCQVTCIICGAHSNYHASWFLVLENRWLGDLKILSWHPFLAAHGGMVSVCGRQHLRSLITHWLTEANLRVRLRVDCAPAGRLPPDLASIFPGRLVGELSVHRESRSGAWTGSPETLESILNALTGPVEVRQRAAEYPFTPMCMDTAVQAVAQ
jgi:hypothetical protein